VRPRSGHTSLGAAVRQLGFKVELTPKDAFVLAKSIEHNGLTHEKRQPLKKTFFTGD